MSNEFVMVPRELAEVAARALSSNGYDLQARDMEAVLAQPRQGEPVALPERRDINQADDFKRGIAHGFNACLVEIAKLGTLYTHPVQGEPVAVEGATFMGEPNFKHSIEWYRTGISKHWKKICEQRVNIDALEKKLAEALGLLRIYESFPGYLIDHCEGDTIYEESLQYWLADHIKSLPASAEPSAPVERANVPDNCRQRLRAEGKPYPRSSCAACGKFSPKWRECDAALERNPS